jgi:hypothetical protein
MSSYNTLKGNLKKSKNLMLMKIIALILIYFFHLENNLIMKLLQTFKQ